MTTLNWTDSPHDSEQFERADAGEGLVLERHKGDQFVHAILGKERIPIMFESAEACLTWRGDRFRAAHAVWDMDREEHEGGRGKKPLGPKP